MIELKWRDEDACWGAELSNPPFSNVPLYVETDGLSEPPSEHQRTMANRISLLSPLHIPDVEKLLRAWAAANFSNDELAALDDEYFEFEFDAVVIPNIRNTDRSYFMICLRCELEPEHGTGLACRNADEFAICHPETYHNLGSDDLAELDSPFETNQ